MTRSFPSRPAARRMLALVTCTLIALPGLGATISVQAATTLDAGAVAAPDRYGAQTAAAVLRAGGNAVDAAIATAFTLAVSYPEAGNIGGGGFMTVYFEGEPYFLDYREIAPSSASRDMYLDQDGEVIENKSLIGYHASGVPGTVMGMWEAHQRFGSLPWAELVRPAIALARDGIEPAERANQYSEDETEKFRGRTNFHDYFSGLDEEGPFRQPELAATLERIATQGADDFYRGETAQLIVAEMARGGGNIGLDDLAGYRAHWREPIALEWRGATVYAPTPPSSGGIGLAQLLTMKERLGGLFQGVALNSAQYVHLISEIEKRVFADRADYLGDPDFSAVPTAQLVDRDYLDRRAGEVRPRTISPTEEVQPGLEHFQTTHYSIVDRFGNAASNTYTLNFSFGSGVVVTGAGFLLNNEMDDFSARAGVPNAFGVVGGDANAIAPGKRMLSSMTPTIVTRDGQVELVIGTPGGSRIFTSIFQAMNNLYDYDLPLDQALAAPRFHHQLLPKDLIYTDPAAPLDADTVAELERRGYRVEPQGWRMGDLQAIQVESGSPIAVSDPRGRGVALRVEAEQHVSPAEPAPAEL
ncbi:gamma-glutamyltransferase [Halotalea alkalilenta]|uniref:gamma-glutamyltransferase n=1 Tax=Halotalea alkalilenta TaxID=376489 RepID=UPI000AEE9650|nr:gamma-glutamyltransferase [Halotalea alkalilenta]